MGMICRYCRLLKARVPLLYISALFITVDTLHIPCMQSSFLIEVGEKKKKNVRGEDEWSYAAMQEEGSKMERLFSLIFISSENVGLFCTHRQQLA